ncbi:MAG: helix-turn-helix transcriptional regulator [Kordiimonadaceae bacterium]|nr:helix-turn-helix transcriptional regulator [Kordiimonadaceae bacterium]
MEKNAEPQASVKVPDPIDVHVGHRVRVRRKMLGFSQTQLGNDLGITFQQVQKYERGANRIGSSRLFHISNSLNVPVEYFFEGAETKLPGYEEQFEEMVNEASDSAESQDLLKMYYKIKNPRIREQVLSLATLLAQGVPEYNM